MRSFNEPVFRRKEQTTLSSDLEIDGAESFRVTLMSTVIRGEINQFLGYLLEMLHQMLHVLYF